MRQLDMLWNYQQADKKVVEYEKEIRQFPLRQQLLKLRNFVADQQTVINGMENDANKALERLEELAAQRDKAAQTFADIQRTLEEGAYETAAQVKKAISLMTTKVLPTTGPVPSSCVTVMVATGSITWIGSMMTVRRLRCLPRRALRSRSWSISRITAETRTSTRISAS